MTIEKEQKIRSVSGSEALVKPPLEIDSVDDVVWDGVADVVVVGLGGAGATAAIEAHENGANVLVLERFEGGGATAKSGGIVYAGGGTSFQQQAGIEDNPENMFAYLRQEHKDAVSEETLRRFCEESCSNIDWLVRHGVEFEGSLHRGKANYPPDDKFLYYAGNEMVPSYAANAAPAARGHRAKGTGWTGYAIFEGLRRSIDASGIDVRTHSRAVRLIVDSSGGIAGIECLELVEPEQRARHKELYDVVDPMRPFNTERAEQAIGEATKLETVEGVRRAVRARNGVVITTGGFGYNVGMVREHMPFIAQENDKLMRLGSAGCNGSGIQLGASVGGQVSRLDRPYLGRMIAPPDALVQGLMVNSEGKRFVNEDAYNSLLGDAILAQSNGKCWIILDSALRWKLMKQLLPKNDGAFRPYIVPVIMNWFLGRRKKAWSLRGLARKLNMSPENLEATVRDTNAAHAAGLEDSMGKNASYLSPLGRGPYFALDTSISNKYSFSMFFTLGGLCVEEDTGIVVRDDGCLINGLYAAGRAAMGIPSDGYISGLSLADCVFSGRRAGRNAALSPQTWTTTSADEAT